MRLVVQRVRRASVSVDGKIVSEIGKGLLVLLGIRNGDTTQDIEYTCRKLLNVRLFPKDGESKPKPWAASVMEADGEVLVVSQFTLYAKLKGRKPDFHRSLKGELSEPMYESFVRLARETYRDDRIRTGVFGAMMDVSLVNDGPVTIEICSDDVNHQPPKKKTRRGGGRGAPGQTKRETKPSSGPEGLSGSISRFASVAALLWAPLIFPSAS